MDEQALVKKRYWSGNVRLLSDFCWCIVIALLLRINGSNIGVEGTPFYFFSLFFWSWNENHIQAKFARWTIHILCWLIFALGSLLLAVFISDKSFWKNLNMCFGFAIIMLLSIGVAIKYKTLMRPKKQPV